MALGSEHESVSRSDRLFLIGIVILGAALFGVCQWVLPHQYFRRDDFVYLSAVQAPDWTWIRAFFPVDTWSYWKVRPLGVDTYFRIGWHLFGLQPFGFFQINLLCHFAMVPVVFRLAKQLGLASSFAAAAALLCISRPPSIFLVYYGAGFASLSAQLLVALSISFHVDYAKGHGAGWRVGSLIFLLLALLCHEASLVTPAILLFVSLAVRTWRPIGRSCLRALLDAGPHLASVAIYLYVRVSWIAVPREDGPYARIYDTSRVLKRLRVQLDALADERWLIEALVLLVGLVLAGVLLRAEGRRYVTKRFLPVLAICAVWLLAILLPTATLPSWHVRFSHHAELPAALLVGAVLQLAWIGLPKLARPGFLAAVWLGIAFILPWHSLERRRYDESDLYTKRFLEVVETHFPELPHNSRFVMVYNADGLAPPYQMRKFRIRSLGGTPMVRAAYYDLEPEMRFHDAMKTPQLDLLCDQCLYFGIHHDLSVEVLDDASQVERILAPGLASLDPRQQAAAARQLARRSGSRILPLLAATCKGSGDEDPCRARIARAVEASGAHAATGMAHALRSNQSEPLD
jgi:hypothetical protein